MGNGLYFRVLGPLDVRSGGHSIDLGGPQRREVLGVLLAQANEVVAVDRLVDALWSDRPPSSYRVQLQGLVSDLRRRLAASQGRAAAPILTRAPGYVLEVPPDGLDLSEFETEVAQARRAGAAGDHATAVLLLDEALGRWRGPAFADLSCPAVQLRAIAIEEERVAAVEERIDALVADGRVAGLSAELLRLVAEHPSHEGFHAQLMTVYLQTGRLAEALAVYREFRDRIVGELGVEPSAQLQSVHRRVLNADAVDDPGGSHAPDAAGGTEPAGGAGTRRLPRPAQLPADLSVFAGRADELAHLLALISTRDAAAPTGTTIVAIDGMAGVGKTALAVHAAHQVAARFPDGQLFLDLCGFSEGIEPVEPADALDRMLRALGVPADQIPPGTADRAGLFRTATAGRRTLMVLDNAASEAQVEPLLPAGAGCLVLVTSRRQLSGLDDAHPLPLDLPPLGDAVDLFAHVAGHPSYGESEDAARVVELCGRLPLAIRIAAARLRARPNWTTAYLAERLGDEQARLAELATGHRSVSAAFALSYQQLTADQRRMFRLLGLHPGVDIEAGAAAALADIPVASAGRLLEDLTDVHLADQRVPHRCRFHDLIHAYAAEVAAAEETDAARSAALGRLLDHYAVTATDAVDLLYPYDRDQHPRQRAGSPLARHRFRDAAQATDWLESERHNLLTAAAYAAAHDLPAITKRLSDSLARHLHTRAQYTDGTRLHTLALQAARGSGDRHGEGRALAHLAYIHLFVDRYDDALHDYRQALAIMTAIGDRAGEGQVQGGLGTLYTLTGRYEAAVDCLRRGIDIGREVGDRNGERRGLAGLGVIAKHVGRYDESIEYLQQAIAVSCVAGDRNGQRHALVALGEVYLLTGRHDEALDCLRGSVRLARDAGQPVGESQSLSSLAEVNLQLGRLGEARDLFQQALAIARDIADRVCVRDALTGLGELYRRSGQHEQALDHHRQALAIARELGDRYGQFEAFNGIGNALRSAGRYEDAVTHHQTAADLARQLGHPRDQARALDGLAEAYLQLGDRERGRMYRRQALHLLTEIHAPEAEALRQQLASGDPLVSPAQ